MSKSSRLTLSQAQKDARLQEFISQEEARGVKAITGSDLDRALELLIRSPRSKDQTLRSPSAGGSTGK